MAGNKNSGRRAVKVDEDYERVGELNSKEFFRYAARIKKLLERSKEPMTIGAMYKLLGDHTRKDWTLDALSYLEVDRSWILPHRYSLRTKKMKDLVPTNWKERFGMR